MLLRSYYFCQIQIKSGGKMAIPQHLGVERLAKIWKYNLRADVSKIVISRSNRLQDSVALPTRWCSLRSTKPLTSWKMQVALHWAPQVRLFASNGLRPQSSCSETDLPQHICRHPIDNFLTICWMLNCTCKLMYLEQNQSDLATLCNSNLRVFQGKLYWDTSLFTGAYCSEAFICSSVRK